MGRGVIPFYFIPPIPFTVRGCRNPRFEYVLKYILFYYIIDFQPDQNGLWIDIPIRKSVRVFDGVAANRQLLYQSPPSIPCTTIFSLVTDFIFIFFFCLQFQGLILRVPSIIPLYFEPDSIISNLLYSLYIYYYLLYIFLYPLCSTNIMPMNYFVSIKHFVY